MKNEERVKLIRSGKNTREHMEQLYFQNIGFLKVILRSYYGLADEEDLLQQSYFGLLKAVESWDAKSGIPFINYSAAWIRAEAVRYINESRGVNVPERIYWEIRKCREFRSEYYAEHGTMPPAEECARILRTTQDHINELDLYARCLDCISLDDPITTEDAESISLGDTVPDPVDVIGAADDKLMQEQARQTLSEIARDLLDGSEQAVLSARYIDGLTRQQTGKALGIGYNAAQNIEARALRKLRAPGIRKRLLPYIEPERAYMDGLKHTSFSFWKDTGKSSVEAVILDAERENEK